MEDTLRVARIATERTHNTKEAINGAQMIAAAVFLARHGKDRKEIRKYAEEVFGYKIPEGEAGLNRLQSKNKEVASCGCYPEDLDMVMNFEKYIV